MGADNHPTVVPENYEQDSDDEYEYIYFCDNCNVVIHSTKMIVNLRHSECDGKLVRDN